MSARCFVSRLIVAVGAVMALWSAPALASPSHHFLSSFGSFTNVQGVAIDQSTGDVYVLDTGAGEGSLLKFDSAGNPLKFTGLAGEPAAITGLKGGGSSEDEIAVDNSNGPAKGDVYIAVSSSNGESIDVIASNGEPLGTLSEATAPWGETCGVAVDSSGNVYVGVYAGHIDKFVPVANPVTNADYASSIAGAGNPCNLAVDSQGNVFASKYSLGPISRYEASQFGSLGATGSVVDASGSTLAVDPSDNHVLVDEGGQVAEFGARGEPFEEPIYTFAQAGAGAIVGSFGIAVNETSGDIYVSDGAGHLSIFGPPVDLPTVATSEASSVTLTGVTLNGTVNPEGNLLTDCKFEYGTTIAYGQSAPCATNPGSGSTPVAVTAAISGLQSGAKYHYRLVASNANGESTGADQPFSTGAIPVVEEESVIGVSGSGATLQTVIDPMGGHVTYYVEYGTSEAYGATAPVPDAEVGATEGSQTVTTHIQGLQLAATYHYRFVATDTFGVSHGMDQTFTTQSTGGKLELLDGRRWEEVSPQQKHGAAIEMVPSTFGGGEITAAEDGSGIAYLANSPIDESPPGNRGPEPVQILAKRAGGSWDNRTIATPHDELEGGLFLKDGSEYRLFSPDLSLAVVEPREATPLAAGVTERTQYVRDNAACEVSPSTCYTPLVTPADTQPGVKWGGPTGRVEAEEEFAGASADLRHVLIYSNVQLTATGAGQGLYEWSGGQLQPVSVLPESEGGGPVNGWLGAQGIENHQGYDVRNAVSSDGSRVIWSSGAESGHLYMRDTAKQQTVRLDVAQPGATGGSGVPVFDIASSDGSRIFFTDKAELTVGASMVTEKEEEGNLYECHIVENAGKVTCILTDVTNASIEGQVLGLSQDSSYVYFVSSEVLANGAGVGSCGAGLFEASNATCNLYVAHRSGTEWSIAFIATLSKEDKNDWGEDSTYKPEFGRITARVSQNGRYVAFMSDLKLTGYDNRDVNSGAADEEVFLYDASSGKLRCVSCDPSGARPVGVLGPEALEEDPLLVDSQGVWDGRWIAANLSPGISIGGFDFAYYQPRYLSDRGRMFFDSSDGLVPHDTNGLEDVYEYEPEGAGSCSSAEGCLDLITSGTSKEESVFLDASASGDDAFVLTGGQLVSGDKDTSLDIYDAHVCTASVPCSESAVAPPACDTSDSCKAAPTPQPPLFGSPSSETFSGSGNVVSAAAGKRAAKSAGLTRAQKLARALKACTRRHGAKARARCRASARKKFAAEASSRRSKHTGSATAKRFATKSTRAGRGR